MNVIRRDFAQIRPAPGSTSISTICEVSRKFTRRISWKTLKTNIYEKFYHQYSTMDFLNSNQQLHDNCVKAIRRDFAQIRPAPGSTSKLTICEVSRKFTRRISWKTVVKDTKLPQKPKKSFSKFSKFQKLFLLQIAQKHQKTMFFIFLKF